MSKIESLKKDISIQKNRFEYYEMLINDLEIKKKEALGKINFLKQEIEKLTPKPVIVSEHALLRYIERNLKVNTEEVKNKIINEIGLFKGNGEYKGFKIKNNVVTTYYLNKHFKG